MISLALFLGVIAALGIGVFFKASVWSALGSDTGRDWPKFWSDAARQVGGKLRLVGGDPVILMTTGGGRLSGKGGILSAWYPGVGRGLKLALVRKGATHAEFATRFGPVLRGILPHHDAYATPASELRAFLTPVVRRLLERLAGLGPVHVRLSDDLAVQVKAEDSTANVVHLARLSADLAGQVRSHRLRAEGIVLGDVVLARGECQVCGASLNSDSVSCARCDTPHHRDCWEYAGRCSTYACGEKRFVG